MENPLQSIGLFATPKSTENLQDYLDKFTGGEKMVAMTCAYMAWNLAVKIVDEAIKEQNNDIDTDAIQASPGA